MSLAEADKAAAAAGVNLQFIGLGVEEGDAVAADQSVPAGTEVPLGTVVSVTFLYQDCEE